jgi:hypothetical protein
VRVTEKTPHGAIRRTLPSADYEPPSVINSKTRSLWLRRYAAGVLSHAGWSVGQIARALRCDRSLVLRILRMPEVLAPFKALGGSEMHAIDPVENQAVQHFFQRKRRRHNE